ncbi:MULTISPECIES: aldehyde dehydrogenase family protein [Streptomyces]|uniref:aldehyde dehydrogenase family protein n=1 Tax=Streptomyces TaxID=1883 RepID=UPI001E357508|nr:MULTISPECIES: aldehyde dehydrogenase family protein [Streptomyces]UFQ19065.1 aldehyde dehydrogenase family protein [Streptomyces huasconensis]WCL88684.1 aldehyde dehydrogenase family protein [Streptomyces sp. JCM 35825]
MTTSQLQPLVGGETLVCDETVELRGVDGAPVAEVGVSPTLLLTLALRRARGAAVSPEVFSRAGTLFAEAELAGESADTYRRRVVAATGLPHRVVGDGLRSVRNGLAQLEESNARQLPAPTAGVHWVPRGRTLGIVTPSNHVDPHLTWVRALALGYGVVVRPGTRDPFTPFRLAAALLAAGLPPHCLSVLPGDHRLGEQLLDATDLGIVYGGPTAVSRWADHPRVLTRGPGRSAALLDQQLTPDIIEALARSVAGDGGVRCANTSVIRTSGDPAEVAEALAARLDDLPTLPAADPDALLPTFSTEQAAHLRRTVAALDQAGLRRHSASDGPVPLPDGSSAGRPVVLSSTDPRHPAIGTELPFPFVVVAPWSAADGLAPFGRTLVLSVFSDDAGLPSTALLEPRIRRVVIGGATPWTSGPELPHDGSLTSFLLEPKALLSDKELVA